MKQTLKKYLKKKIVVDTRSAWVYIGILDEILEIKQHSLPRMEQEKQVCLIFFLEKI